MYNKSLNRAFRLLCYSFFGILSIGVQNAFSATSVSRHGFTWVFSADRPVGQFVNGDWWVVGPVTITQITPSDPTPNDSEHIHGTMINPTIGVVNGWDSRIQRGSYNASLDIAKRLPYTVSAGSTVCSARSFEARATQDNPQMQEIAVLTVLASAPPSGSFRPPLMGTDKTVKWNESQLNYGVLKSLPPVANTPALATVTGYFERPWIEKEDGWQGRYYHPWNNHPFQNRNLVGTYGREMAHTAADGLLSLQLNYTNSQKRLLLIGMVQAGIDIFGTARIGGYWGDGGGHNQGRKMVLLLTGMVLNDADMLEFANAGKHRKFQEDLQTFYVTQADVDRKLVSVNGVEIVPYLPSDIGMPEWAINYKDEPHRSNKRWVTPYRVVTGPCTLGHVLTAKIMKAQALWNHQVTFDYYERWYKVEKDNVAYSTNSIQPFVKNMWEAYSGSGSGGGGGIVVPPVFAVGSRVEVFRKINVRASGTLSGTLLGTQEIGARGTIISGPVNADSFVWWQINYDAGVDGWSGTDNLQITLEPAPTAPSAPTGLRVVAN